MAAQLGSPPAGLCPLKNSVSLDRILPVKAACQRCRSRHQKCDALLPICTRCKKERKFCTYAPSRRGKSVAHLHARQKERSESDSLGMDPGAKLDKTDSASHCSLHFGQTFSEITNSSLLTSPIQRDTYDSAALQPTGSSDFTSPMDMGNDFGVPCYQDVEDVAIMSPRRTASLPQKAGDLESPDHFYASIFYSSFWPSHPFLPPSRLLRQHLTGSLKSELASTINYLGSMYAGAQNEHLIALSAPEPQLEYPQNGFVVQSLILLALSSHMSCELQQAQAYFNQAIDIALTIGLHKPDFAQKYGQGIPVIEESWRRTWWELYILDIMFAALNPTTDIRLKAVPAEIPLPCKEGDYRAEDVCTAIHQGRSAGLMWLRLL